MAGLKDRQWTLSFAAKQNNSARAARTLGLKTQKSIREVTTSEGKIKASKEALLELARNFDSLDFKSGPRLNDVVETKYMYTKETHTFFIVGRIKELKCLCSRTVDFTWDLNLQTEMAKGMAQFSILEEISPTQKIIFEDYTGFKPMGPLMYPRESICIYNREDGDAASIVWQHSVETPLAPKKPGVKRVQNLVSGAVATNLSESTCEFIMVGEVTLGGWLESKVFNCFTQCCGCLNTLGATFAKDFAQYMSDVKEFVDNEANARANPEVIEI